LLAFLEGDLDAALGFLARPQLKRIDRFAEPEPLTAEMLAYGQRVRVIGYSAAPIMRRPECLKVFGPRLFGLDEDFRPVEELTAAA
jgi:DUF917 family protein